MSTRSTATLRALRAEDRQAWAGLWRDYLAFYETELDQSVFDATCAALLDPSRDDMNAIVAEENGVLTGLVHYIFHGHMWRPEGVTYLQDLYVAPESRGTGLGRALIEAVYKAADDHGSPSVYWLTQDFNTEARKLYDKIGKLTPFIRYNRP